ncbi:MBL fold metallo-hydrolase [Candidatus Palauibacter polyketidifaciens]|uniref:MBL fold metallo-hydrolase n=1 Tax=Candidatus Palauibacter polyketidifaciens TaxID=3056740 RepID=UPI00238BE022|nr:MBL fold metallo-hydrolase [Candidatus Palauibacter polyketidifaciens]MDE2719750.1 MBL fold metallo-hydrolase [Candidatus Palauibacter polyketidifaciens]
MSRIPLLAPAALGAVVAWAGCGGGDAPSDEPAGGAEAGGAGAAAGDAPPQFETTEVADGVYQFRWGGHNGLFVVTSEGGFAFDPISVEAAATYAEEIRRVAPGVELAAIVYSHHHADHSTGAEVLREAFGVDVPIYAHRNADAPLREAANPDLPPPTDTFNETMTLAGGEIELHYLGRNNGDDIAVGFVPAHSLAFAVDFVARDRFGYQDLSGFHFPDQFDAIEGLLEIPFETIVFGHGPSGDRAAVERQLTYYRDLDAAVRAAFEAGLSEDETAETVLMEDYSHWDRYDDWRELNVRGMHRKLLAAGVGEEVGEHEEGGEHDREGREGRGEHDGESGEHGGEGGHDEGDEGEESGEYIERDATWDATRRGARLILSYDPGRDAFVGTVENTTDETLCAVRVEVHLSSGTELGPTQRTNVDPGGTTEVELAAGGEAFERWTAHPEMSRCAG